MFVVRLTAGHRKSPRSRRTGFIMSTRTREQRVGAGGRENKLDFERLIRSFRLRRLKIPGHFVSPRAFRAETGLLSGSSQRLFLSPTNPTIFRSRIPPRS